MEDNITNLDELFTLPIGLKPIVKLDGKTLYGSDSLNNLFLDALNTSSLINNTEIFERLVKEKKIVPCFLTGGLTSFVLWKIFAPVHLKNILGFYEKSTKKVYILLSNNFNFLAYTSDEWMCKLVLHECVHMLSDTQPQKFLGDFKELLIKYYMSYFKRLFNIEEDGEKVYSIISFLHKSCEMNTVYDKNTFQRYHKILEDSFISRKENLEKIERLLVIMYIFLTNLEKFFSIKENFRDILYPLRESYKDSLNIKNLSTTCIQELFVPSEVIAIASEYSQYSSKIVLSLKGL